MAENKQRSPGKGNRSDKQRAAQAEASFEETFDESTASTDFGNDVREIRSFTADDDDFAEERGNPRQQNMRQQDTQDRDVRSQSRQSGDRGREESEVRSGQRSSGEREEQRSGQRNIQDMLSDRMEDLKEYAGDLVNGTFDKLKDEWKHNRKSLIRRAALAAVVTTAGVALAVAVRNNRKSSSRSLIG